MLDVIYSVAVVVFLLAITYKIARDPDWYEKSKQHQCYVFPLCFLEEPRSSGSLTMLLASSGNSRHTTRVQSRSTIQ